VSLPKAHRAVAARSQVVKGLCTPPEAYEAVPQLATRGKKCIQGIRKRAKHQSQLNEAATITHPKKPRKATPKPKAKAKKALLPKGKRLRPDQVDAIAIEQTARRTKRSEAHKRATLELEEAREDAGRTPNGKTKEIVERLNEEYELSPGSLLTERGVSQAVALGKAGGSPQLPGPKSKTPKGLAKALGVRAQLLQLSGQEVGSRKLLASAMAAFQGTELESLLDERWKRDRLVRAIKAACPEIVTKKRKSSEDRRAEWLCRSRLLRWFVGYVRCLKLLGFIEPKPDDPLFIAQY
jgi:hypothetical protein